MTNNATLSQCLVLIYKRAALLCVTLKARFVSTQERKAAGFELLLNIRRRTFDRDTFVHFVTIAAADFALRHWVVVRQLERRANFQVTLETRLGRFSWIDNRTSAASGFDVQTPRPVARFAAPIHGFLRSFGAFCAGFTHHNLFCLQSRVGGCSEVADDLFVARRAFL